MRQIHRVGAAAAGVAVVALLGTGCGGSGSGAAAAPSQVSEVPTSETPAVEVTDTELPFSTEDPYATEEPTYPPGPEGDLDRLAAEKGWEIDYGTPSEFVKSACEELDTSAGQASPPEYLVNKGHLEGDKKPLLQAGVPKLCPKWATAVKQAASGKYDRWYGSGTYLVSSKDVAGEQTIPPGTYRAVGQMENCYWERTSESGEIIDNNFATSARKITVTIRSSDGQFTSEGCEVWKPVK
ncbi:hypothetical protein [Streptomyces cinereoruber]|uniref:hypothetical protein n=1 Tax=Streptomyces cinereoruber TaxID=67260 RepID=UPI003C2BA7FF